MIVALLGFFERLALHDQGFAGEDDIPIIPDGSKDDVIYFALKGSTSLLQVSLRDEDGSAIGKKAEVAKERLRDAELKIGRNRGIESAKGVVCRQFLCNLSLA